MARKNKDTITEQPLSERQAYWKGRLDSVLNDEHNLKDSFIIALSRLWQEFVTKYNTLEQRRKDIEEKMNKPSDDTDEKKDAQPQDNTMPNMRQQSDQEQN